MSTRLMEIIALRPLTAKEIRAVETQRGVQHVSVGPTTHVEADPDGCGYDEDTTEYEYVVEIASRTDARMRIMMAIVNCKCHPLWLPDGDQLLTGYKDEVYPAYTGSG